jgi:hypothetical protein
MHCKVVGHGDAVLALEHRVFDTLWMCGSIQSLPVPVPLFLCFAPGSALVTQLPFYVARADWLRCIYWDQTPLILGVWLRRALAFKGFKVAHPRFDSTMLAAKVLPEDVNWRFREIPSALTLCIAMSSQPHEVH